MVLMEMLLTAVYEEIPEAEGGGYVAYTEELPGAISEGDTLEEARENLRDAVQQLLEANRQMTAAAKLGKKVTRETIAVSLGRL
jgi:predicted RNase H-like HicB family nuclease